MSDLQAEMDRIAAETAADNGETYQRSTRMLHESVADWPGLAQHDLAWCVRRMPKPVRELLKGNNGRLVLAGGFIRSCITNEKINDVDLFSSSTDVAEILAKQLAGEDRLIKTVNAWTVCSNPSVQFICRWTFADPFDVVKSFDFTIARSAIWHDNVNGKGTWRSVCDPSFYQDLAAKRLIYCAPIRAEEAGGSLLRVLKFYQRGYRIPLDSMGAVIARLCSAFDWKKCAHNEQSVAKVLTGLLKEVDPSIDPDHIAHLPGIKSVKSIVAGEEEDELE